MVMSRIEVIRSDYIVSSYWKVLLAKLASAKPVCNGRLTISNGASLPRTEFEQGFCWEAKAFLHNGEDASAGASASDRMAHLTSIQIKNKPCALFVLNFGK